MPIWLYLALLAAGTYTTYDVNSKAADRTDKAALLAQKNQTDLTREGGQKVVDFANQAYDPQTRVQDEQVASSDARAQLMQQLVQSRDRGIGEQSSGGKITEAYSTDRAKTILNTMSRASTLANLMGKVRGSADSRFNEGIETAGLGGELADLSSLAKSRLSTDNSRIQFAGRPDQEKLALGGFLSGAGNYGLSNAANKGSLFGGTP